MQHQSMHVHTATRGVTRGCGSSGICREKNASFSLEQATLRISIFLLKNFCPLKKWLLPPLSHTQHIKTLQNTKVGITKKIKP